MSTIEHSGLTAAEWVPRLNVAFVRLERLNVALVRSSHLNATFSLTARPRPADTTRGNHPDMRQTSPFRVHIAAPVDNSSVRAAR